MALEIISANDEVFKSSEERRSLQAVLKMAEENDNLKPLMEFVSEEILLMIIRSYPNNAEKALEVMTSIYHYSTEVFPELFSRINAEKVKAALDAKIYQIVKTGSSSPGILVLRIKRWKPSEVSSDDLQAAGMLYIYEMAKSVSVQRNGVLFIVNNEGFGFNHARHFTYDMAKKLFYTLTYASPFKIIGHIVINSHMLFEKIFNVIKFVIPEKTRKELYILKKDLTQLHNLVPSKEKLPKILGGDVSDEYGFLDNVETAIKGDTTLQDLFSNFQSAFKKNKQ